MPNREVFGGWFGPGLPRMQHNRRFYGTFDWKRRKAAKHRDNPFSLATGLFKPRGSRAKQHERKMEHRGYRQGR